MLERSKDAMLAEIMKTNGYQATVVIRCITRE